MEQLRSNGTSRRWYRMWDDFLSLSLPRDQHVPPSRLPTAPGVVFFLHRVLWCVRLARGGTRAEQRSLYDTNGIKSSLPSVSEAHGPRPKQSEAVFLLWVVVSSRNKEATQAGRPKRQSSSCEETVKREEGVSKKNRRKILRPSLHLAFCRDERTGCAPKA